MFQINKEMKAGLAGVEDFSEFFSEDEFQSWIESVKEKYSDNEKQLKKVLGVAYFPTLNFIGFTDEPRADILAQLGLEGASDEYIAKLGFLLYKDEEFKEFGDESVTENLNYFQFEDGETVRSYWALAA